MLALLLLTAAGSVAACDSAAAGSSAAGSSAAGSSATARPSSAAARADALSERIARVEFQRQCTIGSASFADEAGITADLDDRLTAAGLTHAQWKRWHDDLVTSPALVAQLRTISGPGCAGA